MGLPDQNVHYSILGICLCLEGVLSACYHLCPTPGNLQFDYVFWQ